MASWTQVIGPVVIDFGGVELGNSVGGSTFTFKESAVTTKIDATGTLARSKYINGAECKVTGAIGEATLAQIAAITGGTVDGDELTLKARVGTNLMDSAETCILKPIIAGVASTNNNEWIYIPKATIMPLFEVQHNLADGADKVFGYEIEGHPVTADDIASSGDLFGDGWSVNDVARFGNKAA